MELFGKEIDQQRTRLSQVIIDLKSKYLPTLHRQADTLRNDTHQMDLHLTQGLSGLQSKLKALMSHLARTEINNLTEAIQKETDQEKKQEMENSLDSLQKDYDEKAQEFMDCFLSIIKDIHQQQNLLAHSLLYEQCQKAYEIKEQDLIDHLKYIENTLVPLLNDVKEKLSKVDSSLEEQLKTSPFKDAIDVLPSTLNIGEAAEKQPELLAASLGYETTLSILKGLWKMTEVTSYFDEHLELKEQVAELEEKIEQEKVLYDSLKQDLEDIRNLYTVYNISQYFLNLGQEIAKELNLLYHEAKEAFEKHADLQIHIKKLQQYLQTLNIVWE